MNKVSFGSAEVLILSGAAIIIAGLFGIYPPGFVAQVVAFAFGLAASTIFPALFLGIFYYLLLGLPRSIVIYSSSSCFEI